MAINLNDNLHIQAPKPVDYRMTAANQSARDAIPTGELYDGLRCWLVSPGKMTKYTSGAWSDDTSGLPGGVIFDEANNPSVDGWARQLKDPSGHVALDWSEGDGTDNGDMFMSAHPGTGQIFFRTDQQVTFQGTDTGGEQDFAYIAPAQVQFNTAVFSVWEPTATDMWFGIDTTGGSMGIGIDWPDQNSTTNYAVFDDGDGNMEINSRETLNLISQADIARLQAVTGSVEIHTGNGSDFDMYVDGGVVVQFTDSADNGSVSSVLAYRTQGVFATTYMDTNSVNPYFQLTELNLNNNVVQLNTDGNGNIHTRSVDGNDAMIYDPSSQFTVLDDNNTEFFWVGVGGEIETYNQDGAIMFHGGDDETYAVNHDNDNTYFYIDTDGNLNFRKNGQSYIKQDDGQFKQKSPNTNWTQVQYSWDNDVIGKMEWGDVQRAVNHTRIKLNDGNGDGSYISLMTPNGQVNIGDPLGDNGGTQFQVDPTEGYFEFLNGTLNLHGNNMNGVGTISGTSYDGGIVQFNSIVQANYGVCFNGDGYDTVVVESWGQHHPTSASAGVITGYFIVNVNGVEYKLLTADA